MDDATTVLMNNLIKLGKTPAGVRAVAGAILGGEFAKKLTSLSDLLLQVLEVINLANLLDYGSTQVYYTCKNRYRLEETVKILLEKHP